MVRQQGAELWMKGIPHTTQDGVGIAPWKPQGKNKTANEEGHWEVYNKSDVSPEKEWIGGGGRREAWGKEGGGVVVSM